MKNDEKLAESGAKTHVQGASRSRRNGILDAFTQHQVSLRQFISRYLISAHDIDDVSQEAFLRAYCAEQKKVIDQPKAFLFRIAKNLVLSEFSKKSRKITDYLEDYEHSEVLLDNDNLEANIMAQQKLGIYCEAVASLPQQCRRVVLMKKVYGLSHKEIAGRMGISISTVEKHLVKGIRQCNSVITERYGDSDITASRNPASSAARATEDNGRSR